MVLEAALAQNNIRLIEDQTIELKGRLLHGVGDLWARKTHLDITHDLDKQQKPMIILAHNPDSVFKLPDHLTQPTLLLAGHTHGGQVNLPIISNWMLNSATKGDFKRGWYQHKQAQVFVTSGTGMVGLPLRFRMPPCVDVLEIR